MRCKFFLLFLPVMAITFSCSTTLNRYNARKVILKMPELELSKNDVDLLDVNQIYGDQAVVEANIRLAFMLYRRGSGWNVEEIRLGDDHWVKLSVIRNTLEDTLWLDSYQRLLQLAQGMLNFRDAQGVFPPDGDIVTVTDLLVPRYMTTLIRTDVWGTNIRFKQLSGGSRYQLSSAGPDQRFHTSDDLVLVDSQLITPPPKNKNQPSPGSTKEQGSDDK